LFENCHCISSSELIRRDFQQSTVGLEAGFPNQRQRFKEEERALRRLRKALLRPSIASVVRAGSVSQRSALFVKKGMRLY
jgi:hypothetical protein